MYSRIKYVLIYFPKIKKLFRIKKKKMKVKRPARDSKLEPHPSWQTESSLIVVRRRGKYFKRDALISDWLHALGLKSSISAQNQNSRVFPKIRICLFGPENTKITLKIKIRRLHIKTSPRQ